MSEVKMCEEKPSVETSSEERPSIIALGYTDESENPKMKPSGEKPSAEPCEEKSEVKPREEKPSVETCSEKPAPTPPKFNEPRGDKPAPTPLNSIPHAHPVRQNGIEIHPNQLGFRPVRSYSNRPSPPNTRYQPRPPNRRDDRPLTQHQQPRGPELGKDDGGVSDVTNAMSGMGMRDGDNRMPSKPGPQRMPNQSTINTNRPGGFAGSSGFYNNSIGRGGGGGGYVPRNYNGKQIYNSRGNNNQYAPQHQNRPPYNARVNQYPPNNSSYPPVGMPFYPPPFAFPGFPSPGYMQMPMPPMMNPSFLPYQGNDQVPAAMPGLQMNPAPDNRQIVPGAKCEVFASDHKYYPATVLGPLNPNNSVLISFDSTGFHAIVHVNTLKFTTGG